MPLVVPHITNFENARQKFLMQQFMKDLLDMAYRLSFKAKDGTIGGGKRPYNFDAVWVAYVSNGTANTEDTVSHNLGRTPLGIWVGLPDKSAVIYAGGTTWTSSNIFLKASATTVTVSLLVF